MKKLCEDCGRNFRDILLSGRKLRLSTRITFMTMCALAKDGQLQDHQEHIAECCGLSDDIVRKAVSDLKALGLIEVIGWRESGCRKPNIYAIKCGAMSMPSTGAA